MSWKFVTVSLEPELYNALSRACCSLRLSRSAFIRILLVERLSDGSYLSEDEKKAVKLIASRKLLDEKNRHS